MEIGKALQFVELFRSEIGTITLLQTAMLLVVMDRFDEKHLSGVTMPELEQVLRTTRASVSRNVDKLVPQGTMGPRFERFQESGPGLLSKRQNTDDPRVVEVHLTEAGLELRRKLRLLR